MDLEFYALEPGLDGTVLLTDFQGHTKKDRKADNQAGCQSSQEHTSARGLTQGSCTESEGGVRTEARAVGKEQTGSAWRKIDLPQSFLKCGSPTSETFFLIKKNLFIYLFILGGRTTWHVGSQFPDQRSNPCPLHGKHGVLTTGLPGKSPGTFKKSLQPPLWGKRFDRGVASLTQVCTIITWEGG